MVDKVTDKVRRRRGSKSDGHGVNPKKQNGKKKNEDAANSTSNGYSKALLIHFTEDAPTWYSCGHQTPGRDGTVASDPPLPTDLNNSALVAKYRSEADELCRREVQNFGNSGSSDERWVENTMKRGTLKDRIAAMSVVVSTNPVHKLYALDGLLQMAGCCGGQTNARMAQMAAEALEDLFLSTLLPPNRKLVPLDQRPLYRYEGRKTMSPRVLLLWRYEEMIKEKFQLFASQYLMQTLKDGMEMSKLSALRTTSSLLRSTPEGEMQLLGMLVNKLGDPSKKIAAAAGHELRRVLDQHANMQVVIAREVSVFITTLIGSSKKMRFLILAFYLVLQVQQLAHRPHLSPRALYNCIIFLNQLQLNAETKQNGTKDARSNKAPKQSSLPSSLINTYFRLFEVAVSNSKEDNSDSGVKSRLLSALLTGVNRAHPFLPEKDKDLEDHIDSLYRVVHTGPPSASTQALMLLFHVAVGSEEASKTTSKNVTGRQDRFYRALYATLSQPSIITTGKHLTLYFNLLYKAMKHDTNSTRVVAFAKRLLCTTMHTSPPVTASSLFLVNEIMKYHPVLKSCFVDVAEGREATAVLDLTKREPAAALTANDESNSNDGALILAPLWEASLVTHSFHPSVAKFASTLSEIAYTGDPLRDFTLAPFLDKFAYRNPKASKKLKRGESVAERRSGTEEAEQALKALPVNDPSFLKRTDIDEQDEFYHKFFVERSRRDEIKGTDRAKKSETDDDGEGEDEAFDMAENINLDHNVSTIIFADGAFFDEVLFAYDLVLFAYFAV
jgi:ribosome biogenesis protein MAK21